MERKDGEKKSKIGIRERKKGKLRDRRPLERLILRESMRGRQLRLSRQS